MVDRVVLVNGLPATGKSTLSVQLAQNLGWTLISKDAIKEALGAMAWPQVPSGRLGAIALDAMYALAREIEGGVVLDSIWLSTRDRPFLAAGLATMGEPAVVEVWCEVPEPLARTRFDTRHPQRHPMHEAWRPGFWDAAGPVTENPIRVDTSGEVDIERLGALVLDAGSR